jgi:hypothetical protein
MFAMALLVPVMFLSALPTPAPHPRLLASRADFDRLRSGVVSDPVLKAWYARLRTEGDALVKKPPYRYELRDGVRLLMVSRDVLRVVTTEALLYKIGGDPKDLARAWAELDNVARFGTWHPAHFLDVAEMAAAVALGYDWLYDDLSADQKTELRAALVEKALTPAAPYLQASQGWAAVTNNWNFVCNGGITLASLAIADEDPSWLNRLLPLTLKSLPKALAGYAPDGAWNESPGYWDYGTTYLVELIASLQLSLGSDFGLLQTPGLDKTGLFAAAMSGPGRYFFGFGDVGGPRGWVSSPALWYLGKVFHQPLDGWARRAAVGGRPLALDLLWYDPDQVSSTPGESGLSTDLAFRRVEVATFRASWSDPDSLFVGFKGTAFPDRNHTDLDSGTVFVGVFGSVWVTDLGSDDYNLPGYFTMDAKKADNRWNLYRKRAEGHNTLVINPGRGPDQLLGAYAPMTVFHPGTDDAWAIVDLTKVYPGTKSVQRGVKLPRKESVLIQDEVHLKAPGDIWWFLHLEKDVSAAVAEDGRSAVLSKPKTGDTVLVRLVSASPEDKFSVADAVPLPTSPQVRQNQNDGYRKLVLQEHSRADATWAVEIIPRRAGSPEPAGPAPLVPLAQW